MSILLYTAHAVSIEFSDLGISDERTAVRFSVEFATELERLGVYPDGIAMLTGPNRLVIYFSNGESARRLAKDLLQTSKWWKGHSNDN